MFNVEYPGDLSVILDAAKERFKWPVNVFINKFRKKIYVADYASDNETDYAGF